MGSNEQYCLIIDSHSTDAEFGKRLTTYNLATEEPLVEVAAIQSANINRAVKNAGKAYTNWRSTPPTNESAFCLQLWIRSATKSIDSQNSKPEIMSSQSHRRAMS